MSASNIDRFPVKNLPARYGIARSAIYTRMEALKIKRFKVGNSAYVDSTQLQLMDALDQWIQQGGTTAEFLERRGQLPDPTQGSSLSASAADVTAGLSNLSPDILEFVRMLVSEIYNQMPRPEAYRLANLQALEQASQANWLLSTSDVSSMINLSKKEVLKLGNRFTDGGFIFTRSGFRANGEVAWQVSKGKR